MIVFIVLTILGIGMYFANTSLIACYMKRYYPNIRKKYVLLSNGKYLWEHIARLVVPKWVYLMGTLCYPVATVGVVGTMWSVFA